jgi:hypothetical protein
MCLTKWCELRVICRACVLSEWLVTEHIQAVVEQTREGNNMDHKAAVDQY